MCIFRKYCVCTREPTPKKENTIPPSLSNTMCNIVSLVSFVLRLFSLFFFFFFKIHTYAHTFPSIHLETAIRNFVQNLVNTTLKQHTQNIHHWQQNMQQFYMKRKSDNVKSRRHTQKNMDTSARRTQLYI